ncbi:MAG TPA: YggT family protein [Anaerolineales bacterium]|nr:YggT family protein [Anaerolineales bacterium]
MVEFIQVLTTLLTIVILADVLVSFFLDPFHPVRRSLDSLVAPLLAPIRRVVPPAGMFDFSPVILLILIQLLGSLLVRVFA